MWLTRFFDKCIHSIVTVGWFKRLTVIVITMIVPLSTTGCYDRQELEQQAFVSMLGVDKAPGNLIDCTFRFAMPVNPSGGGSSGSSPLAADEPITVRAHSITEAMLLAGSSVERTITFSHLTMVLFGEDVAKQGLSQYVQPLIRYRQFRRTVPLVVTKDPAKDVIQSLEPMLDTSTTKISDSISVLSNRTGTIPRCRLQDFIGALEAPHESIVAPLYAINQYVKDKQLPNDAKLSYQAGQIQRTGGNPVDWIGGVVFHGDKAVDTINGEDSIYLRLLTGGMNQAKLDLHDPVHPEQDLTVELHKERAAHYNVSLKNPLSVDISLPIDLDIINVESGIDYSQPATRAKLEKSIDDQLNQNIGNLLNTLFVKDSSDVIPISKYIRGKFATYTQFANYPWEQSMKRATIHVHADVHARRFGGVQIQPATGAT